MKNLTYVIFFGILIYLILRHLKIINDLKTKKNQEVLPVNYYINTTNNIKRDEIDSRNFSDVIDGKQIFRYVIPGENETLTL